MSIPRQIRGFFDYFYKVPHAVPGWSHRELAAILNCLLKGQVIRGPHSQQLAEKIKGILGVDYVLSFNSGRSAMVRCAVAGMILILQLATAAAMARAMVKGVTPS